MTVLGWVFSSVLVMVWSYDDCDGHLHGHGWRSLGTAPCRPHSGASCCNVVVVLACPARSSDRKCPTVVPDEFHQPQHTLSYHQTMASSASDFICQDCNNRCANCKLFCILHRIGAFKSDLLPYLSIACSNPLWSLPSVTLSHYPNMQTLTQHAIACSIPLWSLPSVTLSHYPNMQTLTQHASSHQIPDQIRG